MPSVKMALFMVPEAGLEPARNKIPRDFKSLVSTNSTTPANLEATPGFEPGMRILQTLALPLGDVANSPKKWSGKRDSNPRHQPWQGCALPLSYSRFNVRRKFLDAAYVVKLFF